MTSVVSFRELAGGVVERTETEAIATVADVKAEAGRRIEARYPIFKQLNIDRAGGEAAAAMGAWIDAVRAASDAIEADLPMTVPAMLADPRWEV